MSDGVCLCIDETSYAHYSIMVRLCPCCVVNAFPCDYVLSLIPLPSADKPIRFLLLQALQGVPRESRLHLFKHIPANVPGSVSISNLIVGSVVRRSMSGISHLHLLCFSHADISES